MNKIKGLIHNFFEHWNTPAKGRYMSFKEIISLSVGGMGEKFIVYCVAQMIIAVNNTLLCNTIGILPTKMYVIYVIATITSFPLTAVRAKMIDNSRSMKGKYRPYLISMGIPTVILGIGFISMPYDSMGMNTKCIVVLLFNIGFQFFYNFYTDAYDNLINVLSPNSIERSDVLSIRSVIENFSPSVANIFLPLIARLITGENTIYNIKVYRVLFPFMLILGFAISLLCYVNTEEKIVQARTHVIQLKFTDAFRAIARNKYFWIISLAGWLGFLESSFNSIIGWMYNYQEACSPGQYSIITAIAGNACFWPNLVAPFFIRRYGKKKILIITNIFNIGFIALMLPIVRTTGSSYIIWFLLVCIFVNQFITSLGHLLNPSVQGDIRDYQQYITGERIDGMFAAVGLIGNVITLATASVLPMLQERAGLNTTVADSLGYTNVYDVLYNSEYFVQISSVLIIASVVGAALNVIPFFFYDLTESDQKGMVNVLKIRAMSEDLANGVLSKETADEAAEVINECIEYSALEVRTIEKKMSKELKKETRLSNEKIAVAKRVYDELHKYETEHGKAQLERAKAVADAGLDGYLNIEIPSKAQAKVMPTTTEAERENRRNTFMLISNTKAARKALVKYFPNGIVEFDSSIFEKLFEDEHNNDVAVRDTLNSLKAARESKNEAAIAGIKQVLDNLREEKKIIDAEIKKATDENSKYYRAAKPYLDAVKMVKQAENYSAINSGSINLEAYLSEEKAEGKIEAIENQEVSE